MTTALSIFITTFNNAHTLPALLESIKWADEIVLLDSFSTDDTLKIAESYGCRIFQHTFQGYGAQKQMALEHTTYQWVLLLDADEALSPALQNEIRALLEKPLEYDGYTMPRQEQMFWRMNSLHVRLNHFLRLFNKQKGRMNMMPVHAAPEVDGKIGRLKAAFYHFGEVDIHTKVEKLNSYSTGLVVDKVTKNQSANPWRMVIYPPFSFIRSYIFKRNFLNGWAGFIVSFSGAFYAFLKYAKLYEYRQFEQHGSSQLPPNAPIPKALKHNE
ncbi:MAG: glycosyltransferase family 2 protein [Methylophilaceae bacterium]